MRGASTVALDWSLVGRRKSLIDIFRLLEFDGLLFGSPFSFSSSHFFFFRNPKPDFLIKISGS